MNCPHYNKQIDNKLISKHLASKGGKSSKRTISPEAQAKMQANRKLTTKGGTNETIHR